VIQIWNGIPGGPSLTVDSTGHKMPLCFEAGCLNQVFRSACWAQTTNYTTCRRIRGWEWWSFSTTIFEIINFCLV